jgi:hypothetical protein
MAVSWSVGEGCMQNQRVQRGYAGVVGSNPPPLRQTASRLKIKHLVDCRGQTVGTTFLPQPRQLHIGCMSDFPLQLPHALKCLLVSGFNVAALRGSQVRVPQDRLNDLVLHFEIVKIGG